MNFGAYVRSIQKLYEDALSVQLPALAGLGASFPEKPKKILILAPHPDDECLMSGFAIRAKEEFNSEVNVLAFTYGSDPKRRSERRTELSQAVEILNFNLIDSRVNGDDELSALEITKALERVKPDLIILPHSKDGHPTHIRCSTMGVQSAEAYALESKNKLHVLFTEFWQSMESPAFLIPLRTEHVIQMGEALLGHVGEVSRNPYHLTLPAFLMDQVRRGSEMASPSGQSVFGNTKTAAVFGQIYGYRKFGS